MAQKRTIKLDLDAEDVIKKLDSIEKELADVKKGVASGTEEMDKLNTSANITAQGMTTLAGGIGVVAIALKAIAISGVFRAFDLFFSVLQQNQRVLDATNKAFETMSIFTRSIVNDMLDFTKKGIAKDFFNQFEKAVPILRKTVDSITNMSSKLIVLKSGLQFFNNIFGITDRVKEAGELADSIVKLRNEVLLAEAEQRLLQLTYQKEAEIQRQIRDDIRKTPEERKKANEKLGEILNQQLQDEKLLANERLRLAELVLSTDEENVQFQVERTNALTELADLEERITSQKSEQKTNEAALDQEIHDKRMENAETIITLETKTIPDIIDERNKTRKKQDDEYIKNLENTSEAEIKITKLTQANKRDIIANTLGQLSSLMGEESKAGKALAIAQALINTYSAATAALAPPPQGAGPIFGPIAAVGAIASGMANVKQIMSTKLPGVSDDSSMSATPPSVPNITAPNGLLPNVDGIFPPDISQQPVQAFVVENDISNAQALQEELEIQATL